mgnify:FL=1
MPNGNRRKPIVRTFLCLYVFTLACIRITMLNNPKKQSGVGCGGGRSFKIPSPEVSPNLVENKRFELLTPYVQGRRSPTELIPQILEGSDSAHRHLQPLRAGRSHPICSGGSGRIRTYGGVWSSAVFKTAALNQTLPHFHILTGQALIPARTVLSTASFRVIRAHVRPWPYGLSSIYNMVPSLYWKQG